MIFRDNYQQEKFNFMRNQDQDFIVGKRCHDIFQSPATFLIRFQPYNALK